MSHVLVVVLSILTSTARGDTIFYEIEQSFRNLETGDLAWGDCNGDGRMDLVQIGRSSRPAGTNYSFLYKNNGDRSFSGVRNPLAHAYGLGCMDLGDYDNDGDLDVLITGFGETYYDTLSAICRNDGEDTFTQIDPPFRSTPGRPKWADWDNDGDLDVLVVGLPRNRLFRNDLAETGRFTEVASDALTATRGEAAFADYDLDGDLDLLIVGAIRKGVLSPGSATVYRNENGAFVAAARLSPPIAAAAMCTWLDIDNDGDPDPITIGEVSFTTVGARVYRNDRTEFVRLGTQGLKGAMQGVIACGDYDNDGYSDVFICGTTWDSGAVGLLYRNNQAGAFELFDSVGVQPLYNSSAAWGDLDNDTRLDIAQMGFRNGEGRHTHVFVNRGAFPNNTPPTAPSGLTATVAGDSVGFTWRRASDDRTPAPCLTYSLRVGTTPGGAEIASPMSQPDGTRLVPEHGTLGQNTMWILKGLRRGTYYWSVQSVDAGYLGSPFAAEETFSIDILARVKGVVATPGARRVTLSWLPVIEPDGATIRVYRATSAVFAEAEEVYSMASDLTEWTDTGVVAGVAYWYWLRAFDGSGAGGAMGRPVSATPLLEGPTLLAPTDGTAGMPAEVELRWAPLSGTEAYHVQVARDSTSGTSIADTTVADTAFTLAELTDGTTYLWRVRAFLATDTTGWADAWRFTCGATTDEQTALARQLPARLSIDVVRSAGGMGIVLAIPTSGHLNVALYDARGALVKRVVQGTVREGWRHVRLDRATLAGGMYWLEVRSAGERIIKRVALPR